MGLHHSYSSVYLICVYPTGEAIVCLQLIKILKFQINTDDCKVITIALNNQRQYSSTAQKYFTLYVKVYWRGKKMLIARAMGRTNFQMCTQCRMRLQKMFANASTDSQSPPNSCVSCISANHNRWVCPGCTLTNGGVLLLQTFQPPHNNKRPASVCVEVKRDSSRYEIHTRKTSRAVQLNLNRL